MTETRRLRWEDGPYGLNQLGYAGPREDWLFCIFKATDDPDDDTHALMSLLPGGFVSSIGAVFPAEPPMVCTTCRRPVRKVPGIWAPSVWEHAETGDGRACPDLGAHLTGIPVMAMAAPGPGTSAPGAGKE